MESHPCPICVRAQPLILPAGLTPRPALQGARAAPARRSRSKAGGGAAGGRIDLPGRNGPTVVLRAADRLEVLATNALDDGFDASPAVAGNDLLLRGHKWLYCIGEK